VENLPDGSKRCRDCGDVKPVTEFWRNAASPDGRALYCIICFRRRNGESADRRAIRAGQSRRPHKQPAEPVPDGFKFCPSCETVLALDSFVRNRSTSTGYGSYCRACQNAKATASRDRLYGSARHYHLRRRYGIGADEAAALLAAQDGLCAVCQRALSVDQCHVDHDHDSGEVWGILCFNCNGGLGQFHDEPLTLRRAAEYLERRASASAVTSQRDEVAWEIVLGGHTADISSPLEQLFAARLARHTGGAAT
jgi:hypothetical protein